MLGGDIQLNSNKWNTQHLTFEDREKIRVSLSGAKKIVLSKLKLKRVGPRANFRLAKC